MVAFTTSQPPVNGPDTPAGSAGTTIGTMAVGPISCSRCGSILDAPRANPSNGEIARKCCECAIWQPLPPAQITHYRGVEGQSRLPRP